MALSWLARQVARLFPACAAVVLELCAVSPLLLLCMANACYRSRDESRDSYCLISFDSELSLVAYYEIIR